MAKSSTHAEVHLRCCCLPRWRDDCPSHRGEGCRKGKRGCPDDVVPDYDAGAEWTAHRRHRMSRQSDPKMDCLDSCHRCSRDQVPLWRTVSVQGAARMAW